MDSLYINNLFAVGVGCEAERHDMFLGVLLPIGNKKGGQLSATDRSLVLLQVSLPYEPTCPSIGWSFGWSIGWHVRSIALS